MGSSWQEVQLQDIVTILGDGLHGTPKYDEDGDYYFINGNNLENGRIVFRDKTKRVAHDQFLKHKKRLSDRTILVSINGTIGNVAYYNDEKVILGKSACYFNLIDDVEKGFVRYVLSGAIFQNYLNQYATGTTIKNVSLKDMRAFSFQLPPIEEQKAISHILGSLDDKIELNRQMNATLESMAQALFKSWFVDFDPVIDNALAAGNPIPEPLHARAESRKALGDQRKSLPEAIQQQFPCRFVFSEEMGWIPEGWTIQSLETLIELIGGGTPKTSIDEYWGGDIPWFSVVDAPSPSDVFVVNTEKCITEQGLANSSAKLLPAGTTIISARGTVGKCAVVGQPMAMNQSCYGVRGKDDIADYYTYYTVLLRVSDLQQRGHGSIFNTITRDTFKSIQTPFCGSKLTSQFDAVVSPYLIKILANIASSDKLTKLRDTLLPKLLSGELRIPDAEKMLEQAL